MVRPIVELGQNGAVSRPYYIKNEVTHSTSFHLMRYRSRRFLEMSGLVTWTSRR
jgi:hypothetical protein